MTRHDQDGRVEPRAGGEQPGNQGSDDGEGRVGHDPERAAGEAQVGGVGADDRHGLAREARPQQLVAVPVELHCYDACASSQEDFGHTSMAGTDIEDELPGADPGCGDESPRPALIELVPPPERPSVPGHGAPS
ncbi:MAG TPA: hypothetical protein VKR22_00965 [Acidimicrobiales bacterium]|nr:hypothetical protein [Acidimicrobiales bacterium]